MSVRIMFGRWVRPAVVFALALFASGCGRSDSDRHPAAGTVRIGDEPIQGGFVVFEPVAGGATTQPQGYARIKDGAFDTRQGGEPAPVGPVVVRVHGTGAPTERFPNGVPLCHGYEVRMELKAGLNTLELTVPTSARLKEPKGGWGEGP
ncbi:MAG TPA: hypothetical protein VGE74_01985 [Gemmata sp.]